MQLGQRGSIASLRSELYIHSSFHCTNHNTVLSFTATTCWHWQSVWLCFLLFQLMKVRQTWNRLSIRMYTVSVGKYSCKYIQPFLHAICLVPRLISSSARGRKECSNTGCWNKSYKGSVQTFPFLMRIWAPKTRSYLLAMLVTMAYPMPTLSKKHDLPVCCVVALISVSDSKCSNNVLYTSFLLTTILHESDLCKGRLALVRDKNWHGAHKQLKAFTTTQITMLWLAWWYYNHYGIWHMRWFSYCDMQLIPSRYITCKTFNLETQHSCGCLHGIQ